MIFKTIMIKNVYVSTTKYKNCMNEIAIAYKNNYVSIIFIINLF